jgi:urea transporter
LKQAILNYIKSVLNSYAILFFSQNKVLGGLLLLVSFFNIQAGLTGLLCVLFSLAFVRLMGFKREYGQMGLYSFNALLLGLAFGMFYNINIAFALWLIIACLITVVLSVILSAWLGKYNLPILSIPFVVTYWIILLASNQAAGIGLLSKDGLMVYQLSVLGTDHFFSSSNHLSGFRVSYFVDLFFRAISAIIFQNNVIAGIIISLGIFIHSRISFSLLVVGFITVCFFHRFTGIYLDSFSYYHLGANFMMVSAAIGGFFLIPSFRSYLWAIISVPASFLLVNALSKMLGIYNLPVFSLPFCLITISLLYFFTLRFTTSKLQLTTFQHYSPEENLYQYLNNSARLDNLKYFRFNLPFMGSWTVSQGYKGDITHKGEWADAIDFVIEDIDKKTYQKSGTQPEHFYCFNKPVLACADGIIENVVDNIEDNEIGKVNTAQNWGNTVVIKHLDGLYSKVSHLKKNSVKVKIGDTVKEGQLLGLCGNSGRSPEPHLHFQVQATPYIGSKTLKYPFADYVAQGKHCSFSIPEEGMVISPVEINSFLKQAFSFQPGYYGAIKACDGTTEHWEVFKDEYGSPYLFSKETGAVAYFINNDTAFYFTAFYGSQSSLLYSFYMAAYKVNFSTINEGLVTDTHLLQTGNKLSLWLYDIIAPFYRFIKHSYQSKYDQDAGKIIVSSAKENVLFKSSKKVMDAEINVTDNQLKSMVIKLNHKVIEAQWDTENM